MAGVDHAPPKKARPNEARQQVLLCFWTCRVWYIKAEACSNRIHNDSLSTWERTTGKHKVIDGCIVWYYRYRFFWGVYIYIYIYSIYLIYHTPHGLLDTPPGKQAPSHSHKLPHHTTCHTLHMLMICMISVWLTIPFHPSVKGLTTCISVVLNSS